MSKYFIRKRLKKKIQSAIINTVLFKLFFPKYRNRLRYQIIEDDLNYFSFRINQYIKDKNESELERFIETKLVNYLYKLESISDHLVFINEDYYSYYDLEVYLRYLINYKNYFYIHGKTKQKSK